MVGAENRATQPAEPGCVGLKRASAATVHRYYYYYYFFFFFS
jgi:hypothetical protein